MRAARTASRAARPPLPARVWSDAVSEVGSRAARVLLVTDLNSRVPVIVEGSQQRALLAGDNSERPYLRYLDTGAAIQIGDRIVTSGQGGVFPPGLPVGVVASLGRRGASCRAVCRAVAGGISTDCRLWAVPMHCPSPYRSSRAVAGVASGPPMASRAGALSTGGLEVRHRTSSTARRQRGRAFAADREHAGGDGHFDPAGAHPRLRRGRSCLYSDGGLSLDDLPAETAAASVGSF